LQNIVILLFKAPLFQVVTLKIIYVLLIYEYLPLIQILKNVKKLAILIMSPIHIYFGQKMQLYFRCFDGTLPSLC
jgi:hypothetical protein